MDVKISDNIKNIDVNNGTRGPRVGDNFVKIVIGVLTRDIVMQVFYGKQK